MIFFLNIKNIKNIKKMNALNNKILLNKTEDEIIEIIKKENISEKYHNNIIINLLVLNKFASFDIFIEKYNININNYNTIKLILLCSKASNIEVYNHITQHKDYLIKMK
jgi:hypothetical protein